MKRAQTAKSSGTLPPIRPALTPEARESQLISLAVDLVEQRLRDGTATSQETTHFLKLATRKAMLENTILEKQAELISAKTESVKAGSRYEELFQEAIAAVRKYGGHNRDAQE